MLKTKLMSKKDYKLRTKIIVAKTYMNNIRSK